MLPGPDQIVACPHCHGLAKYRTLVSGNTFGAQVWSDGKQVAPMLPRPPAIVRCRHCAECYWLYDAKEIGTQEPWGREDDPVDPAWKNAEYIEEPTEAEYYSALEGNLASDRERERSLRVLAWWRRNDAFRGRSHAADGAVPEASEPFKSNLRALAELLDAGDENDLVMKAEVLRELGEFEAAAGVLHRIASREYRDVVHQPGPLTVSRWEDKRVGRGDGSPLLPICRMEAQLWMQRWDAVCFRSWPRSLIRGAAMDGDIPSRPS